MYGPIKIHPCVLQDIGPLLPLPIKDRLDRNERKIYAPPRFAGRKGAFACNDARAALWDGDDGPTT